MTTSPTATTGTTGMWVVRRPSGNMMLTAPVPATCPAKTTTPAVTVLTGSPGDAANSTPRLPGNHGLAGGSNPLTTRPGTGGRLRAGTPRSPVGRARHDRAFADGAATLRVGAGKTNRHVPMTMINTLIQTDLLTSSVVVRAREIRHHFLSCGQPHDIGCHCLWIIPVLHHVALWKAHRE